MKNLALENIFIPSKNGGFDIEFKSYKKDHTIDRDELNMISEWIKKVLKTT